MSYFVKTTRRKGDDLYLQVYESLYDSTKGKNFNRSVRSIGLLSANMREGESADEALKRIREEVSDEYDRKKRMVSAKVGDGDELLCYGHYLAHSLYDGLRLDQYVNGLSAGEGFRFSMSELLRQLVCARILQPCSKKRTMEEVFPMMYGSSVFSKDQVYGGLAFIGENYMDFVECLDDAARERHGRRNTDRIYFDCTNYYFEIDLEDEFRRKGPSKENRTTPLVGMALMLDADCVPVDMRLYPGNQSEKPFLPEMAKAAKKRNGGKGRLVEVADKGLNCAENIEKAVSAGNGYIFSKSLKTMGAKDREWVFGDDGWTDVLRGDGSLDYRYKTLHDMFDYRVKGRSKAFDELRIVTYNPALARKQTEEIVRQAEKAAASTGKSFIREELAGRASKYVSVTTADRDTGEENRDVVIVTGIDEEKLRSDKELAGYNLLVTSETDMAPQDVYRTYHQLWNIERTFRIMKTNLRTRPVYVRREDAIKGHMTVCYYAVTLLKMLQKWELTDGNGNELFTAEEIIEYARKCMMVRVGPEKYLNTIKKKDARVGSFMEDSRGVAVLNRMLDDTDLKNAFSLGKEETEH